MKSIRAIDDIIAREGGFVDDPSDSGGATNFGITEAVARENGYRGNMRDLPRELAVEIYTRKYWHALRADDLEAYSPQLADELVDTGVNIGVSRAAKMLQRALNVLNNRTAYWDDVAADGMIGPATLRALGSFDHKRGVEGVGVLLTMLNCMQGAYYIELAERREKDERFVYGWIKNRIT